LEDTAGLACSPHGQRERLAAIRNVSSEFTRERGREYQ